MPVTDWKFYDLRESFTFYEASFLLCDEDVPLNDGKYEAIHKYKNVGHMFEILKREVGAYFFHDKKNLLENGDIGINEETKNAANLDWYKNWKEKYKGNESLWNDWFRTLGFMWSEHEKKPPVSNNLFYFKNPLRLAFEHANDHLKKHTDNFYEIATEILCPRESLEIFAELKGIKSPLSCLELREDLESRYQRAIEKIEQLEAENAKLIEERVHNFV